MRQIAGAPGLSIGELVARTLSRQSTVSEVVARLVERGLVTRRPGPLDARQTKLRLSARGRRVMKSASPTAQERLAHGLSALPSEQREALADSLEVWLTAAGFAEVPATMFFEDAEPGRPSRRRRTRPAERPS
jgi:DNA-binding MarR family transcriptional regulator